jgi:hypothetical protein
MILNDKNESQVLISKPMNYVDQRTTSTCHLRSTVNFSAISLFLNLFLPWKFDIKIYIGLHRFFYVHIKVLALLEAYIMTDDKVIFEV